MLQLHAMLRRDRMRAYKALFYADGALKPDGERVLADLKKFCRGDRSTHIPGDPYSSANLEGRREVWLRLCAFLNLTEADFYDLKEEVGNDGSGASSTGRTAVTGSADIGDFD